MSNRNPCGSMKFSPNSINDPTRWKLPAIHSTPAGTILKKNDCSTRYSNLNKNHANSTYPVTSTKCAQPGQAMYNAMTPSHNNCNTDCPTSSIPSTQTYSSSSTGTGSSHYYGQTPANHGWSSNQFVGFGKSTNINTNANRNSMNGQSNNCLPTPNGFQYSSTSTMNLSNGQKTVVRDRQLANEILQKAGIASKLPPSDCLEVITDSPVNVNDMVNCDPNPVCMRKPADCQECYEQNIVVRHLQPPRPAAPPPIIIREHCAPAPPPQPPIVIRQIPARPSTPPALIIRECPPPMPDTQQPTIIDREVPAPPPPPRQVIVERFPTPPPKPRPIIFEKWLPYEEPADRPCIVEKATVPEMPPPKNLIIQYEALEPKIQSQCINEGISFVDPKQFINDKPNGNAEVCYVDQWNNLPDHIKCQLGSQALAAMGLRDDNKLNSSGNPSVVRTHPSALYQQQQPTRALCGSMPTMSSQRAALTNGCHPEKRPNANIFHPQQSASRALSVSTACLPQCFDKYNTNLLARPTNQGLTNLARAHYNPWATTYQVSYNNRARTMSRAR